MRRLHIQSRTSQADGIKELVPGLLTGETNPGMQYKCYYPCTETETAYVDDDCAYTANEIAINRNTPLVYVTTVLEALQFKAGVSHK